MYYKNARAAVVVFDVTSSSSFERAQKWMAELFEKATPGIIIALCGNKIDLDNKEVSKEDAGNMRIKLDVFILRYQRRQMKILRCYLIK